MPTHVDVQVPTLAVFDAACRALGQDPDAVRTGEEPPRLQEGDAQALLEAIAPSARVPPAYREQVATAAGRTFFSAALQQVARACEVAEEEARRCAVLEVLAAQSGEDKPLQRVLVTMDAGAYERLWHEWPMERALTFLMLRSVDHVSENLEDYL
jgi:hypothetical protein